MEENWGDKEFVLSKVREDGSNLQYASEELKDDDEVVLEAVRQSRYAITYASERKKQDINLVIELVKGKIDDFREEAKIGGFQLYIPDAGELSDREILMEMIERGKFTNFNHGRHHDIVASGLFKNRELMLEIIEKAPWVIRDVDESLLKDREFIMEAARRNIDITRYNGRIIDTLQESDIEEIDRLSDEEVQRKENERQLRIEALKEKNDNFFKMLEDDETIGLICLSEDFEQIGEYYDIVVAYREDEEGLHKVDTIPFPVFVELGGDIEDIDFLGYLDQNQRDFQTGIYNYDGLINDELDDFIPENVEGYMNEYDILEERLQHYIKLSGGAEEEIDAYMGVRQRSNRSKKERNARKHNKSEIADAIEGVTLDEYKAVIEETKDTSQERQNDHDEI